LTAARAAARAAGEEPTLRALDHALAALAALALAPAAAGALALRPAWRVGLRERLGALPALPPGAVWVHGASVGEILAAGRFVDRLQKGGHAVFTSTVTLAGREVMRRARPDVACHLAPLDHPWCVEAALSRVRPAALVLIETELWPSWLAAAERRGIPVALVSGRVSDHSYPRYQRLRRIIAPALRRIAALGARTDTDAERFLALGAPPGRVSVTGDLKLEPAEDARPLAFDLARLLGGARLIVAGSTHPGEELAALSALAQVEQAGMKAALVLAPRRLGRADEIARFVRASGRTLRRRTLPGDSPLQAGEVLLLDSVGELASVYARAEVAFVGGTLAPVGGHNVLEPVFLGRPVLFGPHTENARHAAEILTAVGAGIRVADEADLARRLVALLADPEDAGRRGQAGRRALLAHRGSAERAAGLIEALLAQGSARER
jgi:3-deoxy-D-manno-octulosonic-acid transferase